MVSPSPDTFASRSADAAPPTGAGADRPVATTGVPRVVPASPALASAGLPSASTALAGLKGLVKDADYPCLGARSVFNRDRATVRVFEELGAETGTATLLAQLARFAETTDVHAGFASFVAVFRGPDIREELHFEQLLWRQLQQLHDADDHEWAPQVSSDPTHPHFAFSVGGTAYFVVGLHPRASRLARRAPTPVLVFNLHQQFDELRADDRYPRMRDTIRRRDVRLQGSVNPMAADHGAVSEARQYAGRQVGEPWRPPFSA